ncbi:MAG TPA: hypothetical protein EYP56_19325 [Planctomycetaceae bacterium]|nr:hypothetical protein [Planctomycetaceae bacterium]
MTLPEQVDILPVEAIGRPPIRRYHWEYFANTVTAAGIRLSKRAALKSPCWCAFEFRVDGRLAACDFSDYLLVHPKNAAYKHWFRYHYCAGHRAWGRLASFPPASFLDWDQYRDLIANHRYTAAGSTILHKQAIRRPTNTILVDQRRRRLGAQEILTRRFGSRVDTKTDPQPEFFAKAFDCLVSVHVPGSWAHMLDRGQHQLMGLGVCTVSPDIWTCCCGERPQPWLHYVPIRDDFSDLDEKVEWCDNHRDECRRIGEQAKAFFETHSTPEAIWGYVKQKMTAWHRSRSAC